MTSLRKAARHIRYNLLQRPIFKCINHGLLRRPANTANGRYYIDIRDIYIRNALFAGRIYDATVINGELRPFIERATHIVDVGANIGCHTISYALLNSRCTVYAFEPQLKTFGLLKRNISLNSLDNRVHSFQCALGHEHRLISLRPPVTEALKNTIGYNKGGLGIGFGGEAAFLRTLDSFDLPGLDFLKLDVEGAEGLVLQGGIETISRFRPVIFFEHNSQRVPPEAVGLEYVPTPFEVLSKIGYKNFRYVSTDNYLTES